MEEIKKEDNKNIINIGSIDGNFINLLKKDYENIKELNKFNTELIQKINETNLMNPKIDFIDEKTENFIKNKRRKTQYEKESLISAWVDVTEKIFDEEKFYYFNEKSNIKEKETGEINLLINNQNCDEVNSFLGLEEHKNSECKNKLKKNFCLYCNLFKIFEN